MAKTVGLTFANEKPNADNKNKVNADNKANTNKNPKGKTKTGAKSKGNTPVVEPPKEETNNGKKN